MATYCVSIQKRGDLYGYSIRNGSNTTVAWRKPFTRDSAEVEARAQTRAEALVTCDKMLGRRSQIAS